MLCWALGLGGCVSARFVWRLVVRNGQEGIIHCCSLYGSKGGSKDGSKGGHENLGSSTTTLTSKIILTKIVQ